MAEKYSYWQNSDTPFFIIRQISFSQFECYDRKIRQWRNYPDGFREVSLNHECHRISEVEALAIIRKLESTNTEGMSYQDLCSLVR